MLKEISFGGVADSIIAWVIIAFIGLFLKCFHKKYKSHKEKIAHLEKEISRYISKEQKISARLDFTSMVSFYVNGMKHQQVEAYFILLFYFLALCFQFAMAYNSEISIYRAMFLALTTMGFIYFFYLRHQTNELIYRIEKKCTECYLELLPDLNIDEKTKDI